MKNTRGHIRLRFVYTALAPLAFKLKNYFWDFFCVIAFRKEKSVVTAAFISTVRVCIHKAHLQFSQIFG